PEPLQGQNEEVKTLKTAKRVASLFISGLAPDVKEEDIISFLESINLHEDCTCTKMNTKRLKFRTSLKLTVPHSRRDEYLPPSVWPKGQKKDIVGDKSQLRIELKSTETDRNEVLNFNVQGLSNKIDLLSSILNQDKCVLATVTVHWVKGDLDMSRIVNTGHEVASCFVRKKTEHGGCLILIKEDIPYYPLENVMNLSLRW
ncbi:hypothetical protein HHI36_001275, partial [Cryptolaemus montrouzieri]